MAKVDFTLMPPLEGSMQTCPPPGEVAVPLAGRSRLVEEGDAVVIGQKIASSDGPEGCDAHSPVQGTVLETDENEIRIVNEGGESTAAPVDLTRFEGPALLEALRLMGVDAGGLGPTQTLVVSGVNPEPGVTIHHRLSAERHKTLRSGLTLFQKALRPAETLFAAPKNGNLTLLGNSFVWVDPVHPQGMLPLIAHAATGRERPVEIAVLPIHLVWQAGRVAETGMPVSETALTVCGRDFQAPVGTMAGDLLQAAGVEAGQGDRVVLGGPMTGLPARSLKQGVDRTTKGLTLIPCGAVDHHEPNPCIGCGACARICPARLRPDLIASYAEFTLFDRAWSLDAEICFECGLCAYHCPAHRPLLQYIVLAKREQELARAKALQNG